MKAKAELADKVTKELERGIVDKKKMKELTKTLNEKYDIPVSIASDIVSLRSDARYITDYLLYCVAEEVTPTLIEVYYLDSEIKKYSNTKFVQHKSVFPLHFTMIKISDDQWIGSITAKQLMKLRNMQLINYNENAQRTMQHILRGDIEYYRIALNRSAVSQIESLYANGTYIPNTITLNIPDNEYDYKYDEDTHDFVISKIDHFDIIDGYHRYIALSDLINKGSFDYPMELRITTFSDSKAQQMIWQEDQKTKMRKIDAKSLNQNDFSTRICNQINTDKQSNLCGLISRNKGVINAAYFCNIVQTLYATQVKNRGDEIKVKNEISSGLNELTSEDTSLLNTSWTFEYTLAAILMISVGAVSVDKVAELREKIGNFTNKMLTKVEVKRMKNMAKEVS